MIQLVSHGFGEDPTRWPFKNYINSGHPLKEILLLEFNFETPFSRANRNIIECLNFSAFRRNIDKSPVPGGWRCWNGVSSLIPNLDPGLTLWARHVDGIGESNPGAVCVGDRSIRISRSRLAWRWFEPLEPGRAGGLDAEAHQSARGLAFDGRLVGALGVIT